LGRRKLCLGRRKLCLGRRKIGLGDRKIGLGRRKFCLGRRKIGLGGDGGLNGWGERLKDEFEFCFPFAERQKNGTLMTLICKISTLPTLHVRDRFVCGTGKI